jgi:hypothetical protein
MERLLADFYGKKTTNSCFKPKYFESDFQQAEMLQVN